MLELIKKGKRNWLGHWLRRRNCPLKDAIEGMVNGKKFRGRRRYQTIDNIMISGLYDDTKRKGVGGVEIFLHSFMSRLVLGSTQPPIK